MRLYFSYRRYNKNCLVVLPPPPFSFKILLMKLFRKSLSVLLLPDFFFSFWLFSNICVASPLRIPYCIVHLNHHPAHRENFSASKKNCYTWSYATRCIRIKANEHIRAQRKVKAPKITKHPGRVSVSMRFMLWLTWCPPLLFRSDSSSS